MFLGKDNLCCARSMYHPCGTDCARAGRQERVQSTHTNTWGCIDPPEIRERKEEPSRILSSAVSRQPSAVSPRSCRTSHKGGGRRGVKGGGERAATPLRRDYYARFLPGQCPNGLTHREGKKVALSIACFVPRSYVRTLKR
jgi:hypothetical protein